jgi:hypothetical protein
MVIAIRPHPLHGGEAKYVYIQRSIVFGGGLELDNHNSSLLASYNIIAENRSYVYIVVLCGKLSPKFAKPFYPLHNQA